jgi:hypothetical protein
MAKRIMRSVAPRSIRPVAGSKYYFFWEYNRMAVTIGRSENGDTREEEGVAVLF